MLAAISVTNNMGTKKIMIFNYSSIYLPIFIKSMLVVDKVMLH